MFDNTHKLRVAVLFGGQSSEHDVSLTSAKNVITELSAVTDTVVPIYVDRDGCWATGQRAAAALGNTADSPTDSFTTYNPLLLPLLARDNPNRVDVVFPVLHGPMGEDGTIQGVLELADIAYVGCGVSASAVGMDKALAKSIFAAHRLPVVPYRLITRDAWRSAPDALITAIERELPYPLFVKPANMGSSVGVTQANDRTELHSGIDIAAQFDRRIIVEKGIEAQEIEFGILGNANPQVSIAGEIQPGEAFYSYADKYDEHSKSQLLIPAPLTDHQRTTMSAFALAAFQAIDGAGLARVDLFLDTTDDAIYVNEINTMPGFTPISMYPKLWAATGFKGSALMTTLLELAIQRHADRQHDKAACLAVGRR